MITNPINSSSAVLIASFCRDRRNYSLVATEATLLVSIKNFAQEARTVVKPYALEDCWTLSECHRDNCIASIDSSAPHDRL